MNSYILLFITLILLGSCNHKVEYLDKEFPDTIPRRYAEGLINLPNRFQQNMTISSGGSFIIFGQRLNEASDQTDLFITINSDNQWSTPLNLASKINTTNFEFAPYISSDEKFLFSLGRDRWENATCSYIYWVSMKGIKNEIRKFKAKI